MVIVTSFDPSYIYPLIMSGCGFGRDVGTDVGNESTFFVNRLNSVSNRSEASVAFGTIVVIVTFDNVFPLSGVTSVVPFADCSRLFLRNQIVKRHIFASRVGILESDCGDASKCIIAKFYICHQSLFLSLIRYFSAVSI